MSEPNQAVFLSYASQDAEAATRIVEALRAAGVEVWFDQNELVGGDAWDQKIRGQIKACALFVPVISAATQARREGYFRLEWKLAALRTHMISVRQAFLLPVVIDATSDAAADVPEEFRAVQWTRLPGAEAGALLTTFAARVGKLLGGSDVARVSRPVGSEITGQETRATPEVGRRVPAAAWAVLAVVALAAVVWWAQRRNETVTPANAGAGTRPPTTEKTAAPLTEAQKLVAKARQVLDGDDELKREKYFLAEDLVKRAVEVDPAEATAWAAHAQLSLSMVYHSIDRSEVRMEAMRRQAERALSLAPDSPEVQLASANVRIELRQDLPGLERDLRALATRMPTEWRVQRSLGLLYRYTARMEEALLTLQRARALSGGSPIADAEVVNILLRSQRHDEAEKVLAESLATRSSGRLRTFDQWILTQWRGDLVAARSALAAWPDWWLGEDRGAILAWRTWFWSKDYEKALATAQRIRRDYINDTFFIGPRAVLTARAHERAGHVEAARTDWRTVQQVADRELAAAPNDLNASYWKAWALARLGDKEGAQAICAQMEQRSQLSVSKDASGIVNRYDAPYFGGLGAAPLWATVGRPDRALAELRAPQGLIDRFAITRAMLELDPAFDPLRKEPEFAEILAKAPAPENKPAASSATSLSTDAKSVAVLAFENKSDDKANELFSDGLSEDLIGALGRVPGLTVTGWTSSLFLKNKALPTADIGKQLGVAYVVRGSVYRSGNSVRITAQVSRAANDVLVWSSEPLERDLKDSFKVRDEIAGLIANALSLKLGFLAVFSG